MATFKNEVTEIKKLLNAKGPYVELTVRKEDGTSMQKKVFGAAAGDFTVPGLYEMISSKNAKGFWDTESAQLLVADPKNAPGTATEASNGHKQTGIPTTQPRTFNAETNRSILLQVCIKASAEAYSGRPGALEQEKVVELAGKFLEWAEKNAQNTIEEVAF